MDSWKLQDAKARFSELVDRALENQPQIVTRQGANVVVVIPCAMFRESVATPDFKEFLLSSQGTADLEVTRDRHVSRKNDFDEVRS